MGMGIGIGVENPIRTDRHTPTSEIAIGGLGGGGLDLRSSMANTANRTLSDELSDYIYSISSYNPSYDVSRNTSVGSSLTHTTNNTTNTTSNSHNRDSIESSDNPRVEMSNSSKKSEYLENLDDYY